MQVVVRDNNVDQALKALKKKKPVAVCGDLNVARHEIDLADPKRNKGNAGFTDEEREGLDTTSHGERAYS